MNDPAANGRGIKNHNKRQTYKNLTTDSFINKFYIGSTKKVHRT